MKSNISILLSNCNRSTVRSSFKVVVRTLQIHVSARNLQCPGGQKKYTLVPRFNVDIHQLRVELSFLRIVLESCTFFRILPFSWSRSYGTRGFHLSN